MSDRSTSGPRNPWNKFQQKIARVVKLRDKGYAARLYREYNNRQERERDLSPGRWYVLREARVQLVLEKWRQCTVTSEVHRVTTGDDKKGSPEPMELHDKLKEMEEKHNKLMRENVEVLDHIKNMKSTIVSQQMKMNIVIWMIVANQVLIGIFIGMSMMTSHKIQLE